MPLVLHVGGKRSVKGTKILRASHRLRPFDRVSPAFKNNGREGYHNPHNHDELNKRQPPDLDGKAGVLNKKFNDPLQWNAIRRQFYELAVVVARTPLNLKS